MELPMIRSVLFLLPFAVIGCATPTSGTYVITETSSTTDCPETEDTGANEEAEEATLEIEVNEEATEVAIGEWTCPLDGTTFTCEDSTEFNYADLGAGDAIQTIGLMLTGTWTSSSALKGTNEATFACEGADCETLGIVACSGSSEWTGALEE
jgi:hypothetical protein